MPDAPRYARALELRDEIRDHLDDAGLTDVYVTVNPMEAARTADPGCVIIMPPDITFTTRALTDTTWKLAAVCGPARDWEGTWDRLDGLVHTLQQWPGLRISTASLDEYQPTQNSEPLPMYVLTHTE